MTRFMSMLFLTALMALATQIPLPRAAATRIRQSPLIRMYFQFCRRTASCVIGRVKSHRCRF